MPHRAAMLVAAALLLASGVAGAQTVTPGPPGPYVIDVRGATSGMPRAGAFYPPLPAGASVPRRGFGLDVGGHVYVARAGPARLGLGVSLGRVRATLSPPAAAADPAPVPGVRATLTTVAPQMSLNFGAADGWSYLSGGLGWARIDTRTSDVPMPERRSSGRVTLNAGGGARWFTSPRIALGFDVRLHRLQAGRGGDGTAGTPSTTAVIAGIGISVR